MDLSWTDPESVQEHRNLIQRLQRGADRRRLSRAYKQPIKVQDILTGNENKVEARLSGSRGDDYYTRITFKPRPGHSCTCPDWQKKKYGPCKHVLALSIFWDNLMKRTEDEMWVAMQQLQGTPIKS